MLLLRRKRRDALVPVLILVAVLVILAPITGAWERSPQHLKPSGADQAIEQRWEETLAGESLPAKGQGATLERRREHGWRTNRVSRGLPEENDGTNKGQLYYGGQGFPSVQGETSRTEDPKELELKRLYLNGLLEETVAKTIDQGADVAFVKTHKTGSTTLAAIMYRYAARHNLELSYFGGGTCTNLQSSAAKTKENGKVVDVMHYHVSPRGQYKESWNKAVEYYRDIMRFPDRINFVTLLREPRSHLLSYYYYYMEPINKLPIEEFLMNPEHHDSAFHKRLVNPLSAEFGVRTAEELDKFIEEHISGFKLIILTERLDEGLLVLRHMLRWEMIDVTYYDLNETKAGDLRWDGKLFVDRPHFEDLSEEVQHKIDNLTNLDRVLYSAGVKEFEKRYALYSQPVEEEINEFRELQTVIQEYLESNSSSMAKPMYESKKIIYEPSPLNFPF